MASSANTGPPLASDGAVRKKISDIHDILGEVEEWETIGTRFGVPTLFAIALVTPEQSAPIIATTPSETKSSAAAVAASESTQVESPSTTVIVSPPSRDPELEASVKASLAESLIAGVKDSIGPVNPKIIPTLISAKVAVEIAAVSYTHLRAHET